MVSPWLKGGYGSVEGLAIPGRPSWAATLVLTSGGVRLNVGDAFAVLPWSELDRSWSLASWASSESGPTGVALRTRGPSVIRVDAVTSAVRAGKRRPTIAPTVLPGEAAVPLYISGRVRADVGRELSTLNALCRVVADQADLQMRMHEVDRMSALLADLRNGARNEVSRKFHLRRRSVEIRTSMDVVGLRHPYGGRPLADARSAWTRERAVEAVLDHVASNRFAAGVVVTREEVVKILDKEYFSIEPWPFAKLFEPFP